MTLHQEIVRTTRVSRGCCGIRRRVLGSAVRPHPGARLVERDPTRCRIGRSRTCRQPWPTRDSAWRRPRWFCCGRDSMHSATAGGAHNATGAKPRSVMTRSNCTNSLDFMPCEHRKPRAVRDAHASTRFSAAGCRRIGSCRHIGSEGSSARSRSVIRACGPSILLRTATAVPNRG